MSSSSVLVINSGSSSIKYQLVDPETGDAIAKGLVERIGDPMGLIKHVHGDTVTEEELPVPDHTVGMREVLRLFDTEGRPWPKPASSPSATASFRAAATSTARR